MEISGGSKTPTAYPTTQVTTPKPYKDQNSDVAITLQQYNQNNNEQEFSVTTPNTTVMDNTQ